MFFFKMQGLGNDYVYLDCTKIKEPTNIQEVVKKISDRHFGVGSDGVILLCKSKVADIQMKMFNKDGSEAQICGNGIRCVAKLAFDLGMIKDRTMTIETLAGIKKLKLIINQGKVRQVEVDMGEPILTREKNIINLNILDKSFKIFYVSMGNPHAVIIVNNVSNFPIEKYGRLIENNKAFKEKTNVEFVEIINRERIRMRVWERGSGETLACGTGACASVVACFLQNYIKRNVIVELKGGNLLVELRENNHIYMVGPAVTVFKGEWIND